MEGEKKKTVKKVASKKVMKDKQKSLYGVNARKEEKKTTKNKFETLKENVNPQGNIDKTKTDNKDLLLNALNTINKNLDSKNNEKIINNLQKKLKEQETTINSLYGDLHQEGQENQENSRLLEEANIINNDLGKELKELRKKKISPLTDCFNETREKFYNEERLWFNFIICTFMGAFILIIFMLIPSSNFNNKLDYFLQIFPIMALTLSFLYFILIQYNKAKNLRIEYDNKIAIANSYLGLTNSRMPPEQLNLFMENISNVLISKVSTKKDKNLPIDEVIKLLETCAKIGKNIKQ